MDDGKMAYNEAKWIVLHEDPWRCRTPREIQLAVLTVRATPDASAEARNRAEILSDGFYGRATRHPLDPQIVAVDDDQAEAIERWISGFEESTFKGFPTLGSALVPEHMPAGPERDRLTTYRDMDNATAAQAPQLSGRHVDELREYLVARKPTAMPTLG